MNIEVIVEKDGTDICFHTISLSMLGGVLRAFIMRKSLTIKMPTKPYFNFY